jgi:D-sedoheptulose 7-phosphate isomerase
MHSLTSFVASSLQECQSALTALLASEEAQSTIASAGELLSEKLRTGSRVFSCGNGGSMCDAIHFAEELSGRYREDRLGLPAIAIADPGHLSCVGNDYGYEHVFSRYLQAQAREGDVLLAITTSGKSPNVLKAAEYARAHGITVIGLTGRKDSPLSPLTDLEICTPAGRYADRVQELHIKVIHILIELVERSLYPENYAVSQPA